MKTRRDGTLIRAILELIAVRPALTSGQIAAHLRCTPGDVRSILTRMARRQQVQVRYYPRYDSIAELRHAARLNRLESAWKA